MGLRAALRSPLPEVVQAGLHTIDLLVRPARHPLLCCSGVWGWQVVIGPTRRARQAGWVALP